jgi:hypothetical protein
MGVCDRLCSMFRKRIDLVSDGGVGTVGRFRSDLYDGGGATSTKSETYESLGAGEDVLESRFMRLVERTRRNCPVISFLVEEWSEVCDCVGTGRLGILGGALPGGGGGCSAILTICSELSIVEMRSRSVVKKEED